MIHAMMYICVTERTSQVLQGLNVQMLLYCCPLQATVVYQESLIHAHNRTEMIDFWLCSGFSFYQVSIDNKNNSSSPINMMLSIYCREKGNPSRHYFLQGD